MLSQAESTNFLMQSCSVIVAFLHVEYRGSKQKYCYKRVYHVKINATDGICLYFYVLFS